MSIKKRIIVTLFLLALLVSLFVYLTHGHNLAILHPAGIIAHKQKNLIIFASLLSLIVVIPVFTLTFVIAWRYREGNTHARYTPNWDHSRSLEAVWWGVPTLLITILAIVTWNSSHDLDPFRDLKSNVKPMTVQVVALDWKWLFIYPEQRVASINFVQIPINTPINFEITSDAPMNSFWIPQLGGQIYAMSGMSTHLHLMADRAGDYRGSSANISGRGFAGMKFIARASNEKDFNSWVETTKKSAKQLGFSEYQQVAQPSIDNPVNLYRLSDVNLYDKVIAKYVPAGSHSPHAASSYAN